MALLMVVRGMPVSRAISLAFLSFSHSQSCWSRGGKVAMTF